MGQCYGKVAVTEESKQDEREGAVQVRQQAAAVEAPSSTPKANHSSSFPPPSPLPNFLPSPLRNFVSSPARSTPRRFFRRPFPPPSPAKHIQAALAKRHGTKPKEGTIPEGSDVEKPLDKNFGYAKHFASRYELGQEIGHGHFGHTCQAQVKKGEFKGQTVAVKIIAKAKMTTPISLEDVRREVKILKALSGHQNLVRFYDACEDPQNVYIVMELCGGGELLDRILSRGGKYTEEDAKVVIKQILSIVAFCHLQGVVHRDLKPENFLFTNKEENATLKAIDFGLSDFIKPEERLNDIVGSAYYVAPEVLHRSYGTEADVWSIGVIAYILLCGSRPFWARTESGIFRAVIQAEPNFVDNPWPTVSVEAKDFVKRLLNKDMRKRMSAAQALTHPWIRGDHAVPLDMLVYRLVKAYLRSSSLKRAALKALAKALGEDQLYYLRIQFGLLEPSKSGRLSFENFKTALLKFATEAMKESRAFDILSSMDALAFKRMDFQEFCAAAISVHQLEALEGWENLARSAYDIFDRDGNRVIVIEEVAREVGLGQNVPAHVVLHDWVRHTDGKLSYIGFKKLLHGVTARARSRLQE